MAESVPHAPDLRAFAARKAAGEAARKILDSGYSEGGASLTKTSLKGWNWESESPQSDVDLNLRTLRERSRSLYYTAPIATSAINRNKVHVVGSGLHVSPSIRWRELGITRQEADDIAREVKFRFDVWARDRRCDATGQNDFYDLQQIALGTKLTGGEVFVLRSYAEDDRAVDLSVRLVEGDLCVNPGSFGDLAIAYSVNPDNGNRICNGIEVDGEGRVVAYWFMTAYADDFAADRDWVRVPAWGEETGEPNVLHVFDADRPSQYRGAPYLSPVIDSIKQLTRYTDAEIMAAVINGLFSVFITTEDSAPDLGMGAPVDEPPGAPDGAGLGAPDAPDEISLGNGNISVLKPGEAVNVVDAKRPNSNFDGFVSAMATQIGAALNVPSELLLTKFTASYSASRGALLEAWNHFEASRASFAADFCQPIYELWLSEAVARGLIDMPGYFDDEYTRAAWCGANWTGPAPGQLNPTVEVDAAIKKMEAGLSTGEREALAMNGSDYSENLEQLGTENEMRDRLGQQERQGQEADGDDQG